MDFVDWSELVLKTLVQATQVSATMRMIGTDLTPLSSAIFGEDVSSAPGFWGSDRHLAMFDALEGLQAVGLVENDDQLLYWKPTKRGRDFVEDLTPLWQDTCSISSSASLID
ncbi:MAG: hypothetical protein H0X37_01310 [Herpetosiphonaceae bacterium]|nr:hypothetical protein [Herpetosiphonaceae bacterium]